MLWYRAPPVPSKKRRLVDNSDPERRYLPAVDLHESMRGMLQKKSKIKVNHIYFNALKK
jgi:hypothetical protein